MTSVLCNIMSKFNHKLWNNVQYLGDEGETGEVGEYLGDEGDICAGAGYKVQKL